MTYNIVFIHGMFMNPVSWEKWVSYFSGNGFVCHAPAWPFHDGDPKTLREKPDPALGNLRLQQVVDAMKTFLDTLPEKPVIIGHSMGGLIVQKLISLKMAAAGVCIDTAAPKGIMSLEWSFLKSNFPTINPLAGNSICKMSVKRFHYTFCNTMSFAETEDAVEKYVVPESRNIARSSTGKEGAVDFSKPHAPLLFIAGEKDHIIPASLNRKNFNAYTDKNSIRNFHEFPRRSHFICGQKGWEEVAGFAERWIMNLQS